MSRFGMGFGKDPPKHLKGTRPAIRIHSAKCQEVLNNWFESKKHGEDTRPEWFQSLHKAPKKIDSADLGEWKIVWHPRSRMDSPTIPSRKILTTLKDDEEKDRLKQLLGAGLAGMNSSRSEPAMHHFSRDDVRLAARGSKRLGTAGSERSGAGAEHDAGDADRPPPSRGSTASSRPSRSVLGGRSSLSVSSTVTRNSSVLLDRIKGLEDALKEEQKLRQKMQSLIKLESWAE